MHSHHLISNTKMYTFVPLYGDIYFSEIVSCRKEHHVLPWTLPWLFRIVLYFVGWASYNFHLYIFNFRFLRYKMNRWYLFIFCTKIVSEIFISAVGYKSVKLGIKKLFQTNLFVRWKSKQTQQEMLYRLLITAMCDYQVMFSKSYALKNGRIMQGTHRNNQIKDVQLTFSDGVTRQVRYFSSWKPHVWTLIMMM